MGHIFKVFFLQHIHCLHSLFAPVKSNPHGLHSRNHNFQLPVCNFNFRRNCFITRSLFRLKQILIVFFVCFLGCQLVFFSYACSTVYFTFSTIAILAALNSFACTFVTCFSMKTRYSIDLLRLTTYNSDLYLRARSFASFWANRSDPLLPAESCCCC